MTIDRPAEHPDRSVRELCKLTGETESLDFKVADALHSVLGGSSLGPRT
jgi:hypothetical protein